MVTRTVLGNRNIAFDALSDEKISRYGWIQVTMTFLVSVPRIPTLEASGQSTNRAERLSLAAAARSLND